VRIADFALERYFARWEFAVEHLLCASDVEGWRMADLLALADDEMRARWDGLRLGYTESTGDPLLRTEIASLYEDLGADDTLVFSGAEEAIFCLFSTLVGPGDHAVVTWPGYQSLYEVARAAGAGVTLHELREADGWALDVERLVASLRPATRVVVVNAPHNPTGMLPSPGEWQALADACSAAGVRLVADEVYRLLEHDGRAPLPAGADLDPAFVSIGVLSKSFALAGLRIGWLATRDRDLLARCAAFKDYTTICAAAPSEILGVVALRAREAVLARSRALVGQNRAGFDAFLAERPGFASWVLPAAGSVGFPRLAAGLDADLFTADLVRARGVLLLPGSAFGHAGNHVRVGLGREDFPLALERLADFLDGRASDQGASDHGASDKRASP
jgi:aspartate/methionine/tyrosine aminotransferase